MPESESEPHRFHTVHDGRPTLQDRFEEILAAKQRAVKARQTPPPESAEVPRAVFAAACAEIGRELGGDGFRYLPSTFKCSKRSGDLTFELQMSSDRYNVAGEHVLLRVGAIVKSRRFKDWQKQTGLTNPNAIVASGQIGYLGPELLELVWELADPDSRPAVIQGIVEAIRELAFPWFELYGDLPSLSRQLVEGTVPMFDIVQTIEFLMCFSGRADAIAAGRAFLTQRADLVPQYQQELRLLRERVPLQVRGVGYGEELAIVSRFFELGDLT
jgi:hypothetical protein